MAKGKRRMKKMMKKSEIQAMKAQPRKEENWQATRRQRKQIKRGIKYGQAPTLG